MGPVPLLTLLQDVLIALALAVLALFVAQTARDTSQRGLFLEQGRVPRKLSLPQLADTDMKKAMGRPYDKGGSAHGSHQGLSESNEDAAALDVAWSGSETLDATLNNR